MQSRSQACVSLLIAFQLSRHLNRHHFNSESISSSPFRLSFMGDFDDRSGVVYVPTPWGRWYQTIEEVWFQLISKDSKEERWALKSTPRNPVEVATFKLCSLPPQSRRSTPLQGQYISRFVSLKASYGNLFSHKKGALYGNILSSDSVWSLGMFLSTILISKRTDAFFEYF